MLPHDCRGKKTTSENTDETTVGRSLLEQQTGEYETLVDVHDRRRFGKFVDEHRMLTLAILNPTCENRTQNSNNDLPHRRDDRIDGVQLDGLGVHQREPVGLLQVLSRHDALSRNGHRHQRRIIAQLEHERFQTKHNHNTRSSDNRVRFSLPGR